MVDGELRELHHMHNGRAVVLNLLHQRLRLAGLSAARERQDHAPVAALEITSPCAAALLLKQVSLRHAEVEEIGEAGNDDALFLRHIVAGIAAHDSSDQFAIRGFIRRWLRWIKARKLEELPRRPRHHEAVMGVIRGRLFRAVGSLPRGVVEDIFPHQIIAIGEGVAAEDERALVHVARVPRRATGEGKHQREEQKQTAHGAVPPATKLQHLPVTLWVRYQTDNALRPLARDGAGETR